VDQISFTRCNSIEIQSEFRSVQEGKTCQIRGEKGAEEGGTRKRKVVGVKGRGRSGQGEDKTRKKESFEIQHRDYFIVCSGSK
jgi:hypothetical protein